MKDMAMGAKHTSENRREEHAFSFGGKVASNTDSGHMRSSYVYKVVGMDGSCPTKVVNLLFAFPNVRIL